MDSINEARKPARGCCLGCLCGLATWICIGLCLIGLIFS